MLGSEVCCFKPICKLAPVRSLASPTGMYIPLRPTPSTKETREKDQLLPATVVTSLGHSVLGTLQTSLYWNNT